MSASRTYRTPPRAPPNLLARALLFRACLAAGDRLDAWFARISPKIVSVRGTGKKAFNSAPLRRGFLLAVARPKNRIWIRNSNGASRGEQTSHSPLTCPAPLMRGFLFAMIRNARASAQPASSTAIPSKHPTHSFVCMAPARPRSCFGWCHQGRGPGRSPDRVGS